MAEHWFSGSEVGQRQNWLKLLKWEAVMPGPWHTVGYIHRIRTKRRLYTIPRSFVYSHMLPLTPNRICLPLQLIKVGRLYAMRDAIIFCVCRSVGSHAAFWVATSQLKLDGWHFPSFLHTTTATIRLTASCTWKTAPKTYWMIASTSFY